MIPKHKKFIMLHALDTPPSWSKGKSIAAVVAEVTRWHVKERGWSAVAYAKIIGLGGAVGLGRDLDADGDVWEETGAGAKGFNKDGIHIALAGGKGGSADDLFSDHYTERQGIALVKELREIERLSGREIVAVHTAEQARALPPHQIGLLGHNQVARKACPCFNVPDWWAAQPKTATTHDKPVTSLWAILKGLWT